MLAWCRLAPPRGRRHLQPWTLATAANFKGYITTEQEVDLSGPYSCATLVNRACFANNTKSVAVTCGDVVDVDIANGVRASVASAEIAKACSDAAVRKRQTQSARCLPARTSCPTSGKAVLYREAASPQFVGVLSAFCRRV